MRGIDSMGTQPACARTRAGFGKHCRLALHACMRNNSRCQVHSCCFSFTAVVDACESLWMLHDFACAPGNCVLQEVCW